MPASHAVGLRLPEPSTAHRKVARTSNHHLVGQLVAGEGPGRVIQFESHLELCWCLCLLARPETADLREQVAFDWHDTDGVVRTHYFDFVVTQRDGRVVAYAVRPASRASGRFAETMPRIAGQARASHRFADVRLLTDADLDPVTLGNAKLLHNVRRPEPEPDRIATEVVRDMTGIVSLAELSERTGLGVVGQRALIRLIRSHHLRLVRQERISCDSELYKGKQL